MKIHYGTVNHNRVQTMDYYPTPDYVTHALMKREKFEGVIWECASGEGHMAKVLEGYGEVKASDIKKEDWVYGRKGVNFLHSNLKVPNIVTNPPFGMALDFAKHAKRCAESKIALFLRQRALSFFSRQEIPTEKSFDFFRASDIPKFQTG